MYALLPAFVSSLFLFFSAYVLLTRDRTRTSLTFFGLTILTCLWQGIWAFLFLSSTVSTAEVLAKLGWLAILPLPTVLYHFATEVAERPDERRWLVASYTLSAVLMVLLIATDWVIAGVRHFDFGFYPKAGPLEAIHITQTTLLVLRAIWLLYVGQRHATVEKRRRLQLCLLGIAVYSLAAADYAVNYGVALYPPGVVFIAVSPILITWALVKLDWMRPYMLAACRPRRWPARGRSCSRATSWPSATACARTPYPQTHSSGSPAWPTRSARKRPPRMPSSTWRWRRSRSTGSTPGSLPPTASTSAWPMPSSATPSRLGNAAA
jgi:hypothetical protein